MTTKFFCSLCNNPEDLPAGREVIQFSNGCICTDCFRICQSEFSDEKKLIRDAARAATGIRNEPNIMKLVEKILRGIMGATAKRARLYRHGRKMILEHRVNDAWTNVGEQVAEFFTPILQQFQFMAKIDVGEIVTAHIGLITCRVDQRPQIFHLQFRISQTHGQIVEITRE